jgi:hypothetical protein
MQHIPSVSSLDVDRVVDRDFPRNLREEAKKILSRYGAEPFHREVDRVRLAALKLASGDLASLRHEVENACCDYRDTLLAAEYPAYAKKLSRMDSLSAEERKKITDADRDQYENWLHHE